MHRVLRLVFVTSLLLGSFAYAQQEAASTTNPTVPPLVNFSGKLTDLNGKPLEGVVSVTFSLYNEQQSAAPVWMETQNVLPDKNGRYSVKLGSASATGLPTDIFMTGEARWLGIQAEGQAEYPRVMLLSVPYALKAGDAQTVGGLPASAFVLAAPNAPTSGPKTSTTPLTSSPVTGAGTVGFIPLWDSTTDIIASALYQSGSSPTALFGLNTSTPTATLDVATGDVRIENGNLDLPSTTSGSVGVITVGGAPFISVCCGSTPFNTVFNTFVGINAGNFATQGGYNTAVGYQALSSINSSSSTANTAVGTTALKANTSGASNTAVGTGALQVNTTGTSNTAVGAGALSQSGGGPTGSGGLWNTAIGDGAGNSNTTGNNNTFVGQGADAATQTLVYATAIGSGAVVGESHAMVLGGTVPNGTWVNVGIGTPTPAYTLDVQGTANFTGLVNFASGQTFPGAGTITGVTPTPAGGLAGGGTSGNVALSLTNCPSGQVLQSNGAGWACATITGGGAGTITGITTPSGSGLLGGATSGNVTLNVDPTQIPYLNLPNIFTQNQTVTGNVSATSYNIGSNVFAYGSFTKGNAFVGFSGGTAGAGTNNTAHGLGALGSTPAAASAKRQMGAKALFGTLIPVSSYNTATGVNALGVNTLGYANTADGATALTANTAGFANTAEGYAALEQNTTGIRNTANGTGALINNTTGSHNTGLGFLSGVGATSPALNNATAIGSFAEVDANNALVLGSIAGLNSCTAAFSCTSTNVGIGTTTPTFPLHIGNLGGGASNNFFRVEGPATPGTNGLAASFGGFGDFGIDAPGAPEGRFVVKESGQVGIGIATPQSTLDVNGTANFRGLVTFAPNQTFPGSGISSVTPVAGGGLTGSTTNGNVSLGLIKSCGTGQILQWNGTAWVCAVLVGGGTITSVIPGAGLTGGGNSGNVTLNVDPTQVPFLNAANTFTQSQTVGGNLTATGVVTGSAYQIGSQLFAFGSYTNASAYLGFAGNPNNSGVSNTGVGYTALSSDTGGTQNTAIGFRAMFANTEGGDNAAIGSFAMENNTGGSSNTSVGIGSLQENNTGDLNTAVGLQALLYNTTGSYNTGLGDITGIPVDSTFQTGSSNTFVGSAATMSTGSLNNATAIGAFSEVGESNAIVLGGISGLNNCNATLSCASVNVGIGTTTPQYTLDVHGNANFTGLVTFAPNQTFPGSGGTVTSVSSGAGLIGGPITSSGTLSIATGGVTNSMLVNPSLTVAPGAGLIGGGAVALGGSTTLSVDPTQVPFLVANNTFTGNQTVNGNLSATGIVTGSAFNIGSNLFAFGSYANNNAYTGFAGNTSMSGQGNTGNGFQALFSNAGGLVNTATGFLALYSNQTGNNNAATGSRALYSNTTGIDNTAMGTNALISNTTGGDNTATGSGALYFNTTGSNNTAHGFLASSGNITGSNNAAFGYKALLSNTAGSGNTAIGVAALSSNLGSDNTATGLGAMSSNTLGAYNTAMGETALSQNTGDGKGGGSGNTALGFSAVESNTLGTANTGVGYFSLSAYTTGNYNTASGIGAGYVNDNSSGTGSSNTFLGALSGTSTGTFNNATAVGAFAEVAESNAMVLGGISGVNNCTSTFNCASVNVGIGTTTPQYSLDVHGTGNFTGLVTFAPNQTFPGTGNGTISGVTPIAGGGLMGGGTSGSVGLGLTNSCGAGQVLQWSGSAWACSTISSVGTITGVTAGTDLVGGGSSGVVGLSLDTTKVPQLATPNTFTGTQTIAGNLALTGSGNGVQFPDGTVQTTAAAGSGSGIPSGFMILGSTSTAPPGYTLSGIMGGTGQWSAGPGIPLSVVHNYSSATVVNNLIYFAEATIPAGVTTLELTNLLSWDTVGGWNPLTVNQPPSVGQTMGAVGANGVPWVIAGSIPGTGGVHAKACSYAPVVWTCEPVPTDVRQFAVAPTTLSAAQNPAIAVLGGATANGGASNDIQILNTVTGGWTSSTLPNPEIGLAATALNGNIYIFGGTGSLQPGTDCRLSTNQAYSLGPGGKRIADIPINVFGAAATVFNGKIYLLGGVDCTGVPLGHLGPTVNSVFIYDPASDSWTTGPSMPARLSSSFSAVTLNGKIFVIDGTSLSVWEYGPPVYMFTKN